MEPEPGDSVLYVRHGRDERHLRAHEWRPLRGIWGRKFEGAATTGTAIKVETGSGSSNVAQNNVIAGNHIAGYNGTGGTGSRSSPVRQPRASG